MSKVFVSYAHSSDERKESVSGLVKTLRKHGHQVSVDTDVKTPQGPVQGWPRWMKSEIDKADWVIMYFDQTYRRRFDGDEEIGVGLGATFEGAIITHHFYQHSSRNLKFIPVLADGALSKDVIPSELVGYTRYLIPCQSINLAEALNSSTPITMTEPFVEGSSLTQLRGGKSWYSNILIYVAFSVVAVLGLFGFYINRDKVLEIQNPEVMIQRKEVTNPPLASPENSAVNNATPPSPSKREAPAQSNVQPADTNGEQPFRVFRAESRAILEEQKAKDARDEVERVKADEAHRREMEDVLRRRNETLYRFYFPYVSNVIGKLVAELQIRASRSGEKLRVGCEDIGALVKSGGDCSIDVGDGSPWKYKVQVESYQSRPENTRITVTCLDTALRNAEGRLGNDSNLSYSNRLEVVFTRAPDYWVIAKLEFWSRRSDATFSRDFGRTNISEHGAVVNTAISMLVKAHDEEISAWK